MPANVIEPAGTLAQIQSYLLPTGGGFALTSVELEGGIDAVGVFDSLNLSPSLQFSRGVLLTSGDGTPPRTNSTDGYGQSNSASGNSDLTTFALGAFADAGETYDAAVLILTFTITDPNVKSLSFDIGFGSDEYPEFSDSDYVDIGAVWTGTGVGAKNYALINGAQPLSVTNANLGLGNFIDNTSGGLAIEYDGIVNRQTILVPVELGVNVIRVGVADTGDSILDSGLFLFGIEGSGSENTGTFQEIVVTSGNHYDSGPNNDIFTGTATQFNGVHITNVSDLDQIFINGYFFSDLNATLGVGSLIIKLDADNNGSFETSIELDDPVPNSTLNLVATDTGTSATLTLLEQATAGNDSIDGTSGLDYLFGDDGNDSLFGFGGSDALSGGVGADKLHGGAGADDLKGGTGADLLEGGAGADLLTGGADADVFFFNNKAGNTGKDKILDMGASDFVVTTVKIRDSNNDGVIDFGSNKQLDLVGNGLVSITNASSQAVTRLFYDGVFQTGGETYYVYSLTKQTGSLGAVASYFETAVSTDT